MFKYRGLAIRECVSYAKSLDEAMARTPDYFLGTDGNWYTNLGKGVSKVHEALAAALFAMPVHS